MATTTNNGWTTPDDSSLVKDGALAIRTLGNAIDSTLGVYAAPGLVFIKQTATSGSVSSLSVNDVFSATYTAYRIIFDLAYSGAAVTTNMRLRVSDADTSTGVYRRQISYAYGSSLSAERGLNETSWAGVNFSNTTTANANTTNNFEIYNPFQSKNTTAMTQRLYTPEGNIELQTYGFGINNSTSYTGFTLIPDSGTINGTVTVLAYKE